MYPNAKETQILCQYECFDFFNVVNVSSLSLKGLILKENICEE